MLDVRVYRTAFLPALVAVLIAAFSLADRPAPAPARIASDAFDGNRAFGRGADPDPSSLTALGKAFPDRAAGSAGDRALADRVARAFGATDQRTRRPAYEVRRVQATGRGPDGRTDLETVTATRQGLSEHRIVVVAARDAVGRPALASLSATAALLELSRVFRARDLTKTLVLVSTSGATTGGGGLREWASRAAGGTGGGPVDAVIVLGDLAGQATRKPWVVPWRPDAGPVPLALERTAEAAVRAETSADPGGARASGQWMRRAVPATVGGQAAAAAAGLPAVLISASGERPPAADDPVLAARLQVFGRAVLRAVTAVDGAPDGRTGTGPVVPGGITTVRNVLPDWAVRLLVGTLGLPAVLAAVDAVFRARRRRLAVAAWLGRLAVPAVPLVVAWVWARLLGLTGAIAAPDGMALPGAFPLGARTIAGFVSIALVAGAAWWLARRRLAPGRPDAATVAAGGLGAAVGALICGLAAVAWTLNPYAAALVLPAAHVWLWCAAPDLGLRGPLGLLAVLAGLAAPVALLVHDALALGLDPLAFAHALVLAAAAGAGAWSTLLAAGFVAALAGVLRIVLARRGDDGVKISTRGPISYAGPGSLGGTESALRR